MPGNGIGFAQGQVFSVRGNFDDFHGGFLA